MDIQLSDQAEKFFNDVTKNKFDAKTRTAYLSKILSWYQNDFGENEQAMLHYVARFIDEEIAEDLKDNLSKWNIEYLPYDWDLNEF